jgi:predicted DNA-binding protein YlxM (UPF0122 family)
MASRNDLTLEQKVNLIKENERGSSYRVLKEKFNVSVGSISNILKRKNEYLDDYECNRNKKMKRKSTNDLTQKINDSVYDWFVLQLSMNIFDVFKKSSSVIRICCVKKCFIIINYNLLNKTTKIS